MFRNVYDPVSKVLETSCGWDKIFETPFINDALLYIIYLIILSLIKGLAAEYVYQYLLELLRTLLDLVKGFLEGKRSFADVQNVLRPHLPKLAFLAKRFVQVVFLYILFILIGHLLSCVTASQFAQFWKMWKSPVVLEICPPPTPYDPNNKTWIQIIFRF